MNRLGPEDYQSNRHIRKILNLAQAFKGDIFYDLGCGRGQLCVVAVAEFGVKRAVGIELHRGRAAKAAERIQEMGLTDRIEIRNEDFMESDLHDATRSEEHTSELQSPCNLVCRLLLEKKKKKK